MKMMMMMMMMMMMVMMMMVIKQDNTTILEQGATTDNLLTKVTSYSVINLQYIILCKNIVIDLCISCVLTAFNKDDDVVVVVVHAVW